MVPSLALAALLPLLWGGVPSEETAATAGGVSSEGPAGTAGDVSGVLHDV